MGKVYIQHSSMCGCERCAREYDKLYPSPVYDVKDDPDVMDCGCTVFNGCSCEDYDPEYDEED